MNHHIFMRHGESSFNSEKRFTGWIDCGLTAEGAAQARRAGLAIQERGMKVHAMFSSQLQRTIVTAQIIREVLGVPGCPIEAPWELNERHLGVLQGMRKSQAIERFGSECVARWLKSESPPPTVHQEEPCAIRTESTADALERSGRFWKSRVAPFVREGTTILLVGHSGILRGFMHSLIPEANKIGGFPRFAPGCPWLMTFDESGSAIIGARVLPFVRD